MLFFFFFLLFGCSKCLAQIGTSTFYGGLVIRSSTDVSPWGNSSVGGVLGRIDAPTYVWGAVQSYFVVSSLVVASPIGACSFSNNASFAGKVVLFSLGGFCSHAFKTRVVAQAGAVAAIFGELSFILPSWDSMAQDQSISPTLPIPLNIVPIAVTQFLLGQMAKNSSNVIVELTYQEDSMFEWTRQPSFVFLATIFCLWFSVCGLVSLWKWWLFVVQEEGISLSSVPQFCMFTCFLSSVACAIVLPLNFLGSNNNTTQLSMVVFREYPLITWLVPVFVFPFYWMELVQSPSMQLKFSRIPLLISISIMQGFTLAVAIVKGLYGSIPDLIRAQIIVIVILSGLAGLFFILQGIRVLKALRESKYARSRKTRRVSFLFVTLGFLLFAFTANYGLAFAPLLGVAFPDFLAWQFAFYVMAALANAIITFTLSPFVLRENQESSYILSVKSIFEEN